MFKESTLEFIEFTKSRIAREQYIVYWDGLLHPLNIQYGHQGWLIQADPNSYDWIDNPQKIQNLNNKRADLIASAQFGHEQYNLLVMEKINLARLVLPSDVWINITRNMLSLYPKHYLETALADLTIKSLRAPKCIVCGICSHCCGHPQII